MSLTQIVNVSNKPILRVKQHLRAIRCCLWFVESSTDALRPFMAFHANLRSTYYSFISRLELQTKNLVKHHLAAATSEFAVHIWMADQDQMLGLGERKISGIVSDDAMKIGNNWGEVWSLALL